MFTIQSILKQHVAFGYNKKRGERWGLKLKSLSYLQIAFQHGVKLNEPD